ncbi:MAG: hypothetical protein GY942_16345, partial [Aestuariibacter sp.]|nr:hypothetical protein [Aestuariibacter sp.]
MALLPWLWLFWTNNTQPSAALALTYAVMAWVMLWLHLRLRKLRWQYGLPWQIAAHLSNVAAVGFALFYHQEPWRAGVFWGTAVFYFVAAKLMHQRTWLIVGAWLLPIGWLFTLEWLNLPATYYPPALAIVVLGYAIATFLLLHRGVQPSFLKPLTLSAIVIAALQAIFFTVLAVTASDIDLIGIAGGFLILGVSLLLYAWIENGEAHAHAGIWLSIVAGGVVVEVYSRDSGQSAAIAAVAAIVLMLAERGLHYLVRTQRGQFAPVLRQGWLLYKRPLLITGWTVSAAALGLALFYAQEPWRAGVFVGTAVFYFVAAYLFRQRNWLIVGAWLLPIGWLFTLEWVNLPATYYPPALAIVVLGYAITTFWLLHRGVRPPFLKPLTVSSLAIGGLQTTLFIVFIVRALLFSNAADADLVGIAGGYLILGISGLLYAWTENSPALAHVGIWLNIVAGGLAVKVYSRGSGLSAAIAAVVAIVLVLTERSLHYLAITHRGQFATILRRGWRLYKRPLLAAGWIISVAAIGAALVRNLVWLGGGTTREIWSLVSLTLVVGLYAGSARMFRKSDFVLYASLTSFLPWTLATYLFFKPELGIYGFSWSLLALILLGISILLAVRLGYGRWQFGAQAVAHGLMVLALLWAFTIVPTVSLTFGVGVMFYETAVWIDRRFREKGSPASSR